MIMIMIKKLGNIIKIGRDNKREILVELAPI